jgi:hypothetical protein
MFKQSYLDTLQQRGKNNTLQPTRHQQLGVETAEMFIDLESLPIHMRIFARNRRLGESEQLLRAREWVMRKIPAEHSGQNVCEELEKVHAAIQTQDLLERMNQKIREKEAQAAILDWLIFHYRNNSGAMNTEHNGKRRFFRFGAVGSPDIVAVIRGCYLGIEVKGTDGRQSEAQRDFQERLERAGGFYILATTIDQVEQQIANIFEPDTLDKAA